MLRSLLTSAQGKSALPATPTFPTPVHIIPPPAVASTSTEITAAPAPERCCLYCGHPLFATPRAIKVRCPKCLQELPAKHLTLTSDPGEPRILTAGKIIIPEGTQIAAELVACNVDIAGFLLGDILASHTCHIRKQGKLAGNILCRNLHLEPGAELQGQIELIKSTSSNTKMFSRRPWPPRLLAGDHLRHSLQYSSSTRGVRQMPRASIALFAILLAASSAFAAEPEQDVQLQRSLDQPITLNLQKVPLAEAFKQIASTAKIPLQVDPASYDLLPYGDTTQVSIEFNQSQLRQALQEVLVPLGLEESVVGGTVLIRPSSPLAHIGRRADWEELKLLKDLWSSEIRPPANGAALNLPDAIRAAVDGRKDLLLPMPADSTGAQAPSPPPPTRPSTRSPRKPPCLPTAPSICTASSPIKSGSSKPAHSTADPPGATSAS